jgi:hypothetical protein
VCEEDKEELVDVDDMEDAYSENPVGFAIMS